MKLTTEQLERRRANMEARKAAREAREAQEKADKTLVLAALRAVLKDPEATTEQRLCAVAVLDNMQHYYIVPYNVKYPGDGSDALIADFAKRMEAYQERD